MGTVPFAFRVTVPAGLPGAVQVPFGEERRRSPSPSA